MVYEYTNKQLYPLQTIKVIQAKRYVKLIKEKNIPIILKYIDKTRKYE